MTELLRIVSEPYRFNGRQITHADFMREWWKRRERDPEWAPDQDCLELIEIRGEQDDQGVVRWYGDQDFIEVFCGCTPAHGPTLACMPTERAMTERGGSSSGSRGDEPEW